VSDNIREPYTVPIGKEIYTKQDILPTMEGREQEEAPELSVYGSVCTISAGGRWMKEEMLGEGM
jgi:hypothetical protein